MFTIKKRADNTYAQYQIGYEQPSESEFNTIEVPSKFESELLLKPGARVIFTESRKKSGYVNGDFGTIINKSDYGILVRKDKDGGVVIIDRVDHYRYLMKYDEKKHDLVKVTPYVQKTNQYPLKLAYAFTIHKSQGQTYERVVLDLHSHIFASGQLYVALSRVKMLKGLYLTKPVSISDIIVDQAVIDFMGRFDGARPQTDVAMSHSSQSSSINHTRIVVSQRESLESIRFYINKSLSLASDLYSQGFYQYALLEIQKSLIVLEDYYHTEAYSQIAADIRNVENKFPHIEQSDCDNAAALLEKLFLSVCGTKHKTVINDKR